MSPVDEPDLRFLDPTVRGEALECLIDVFDGGFIVSSVIRKFKDTIVCVLPMLFKA